MPKSSRNQKLAAIANRGGSDNEKEMARNALSGHHVNGQVKAPIVDVPALVKDDEGSDLWTGQGVLARHRNNAKAYVRGNCLKYFLSCVHEGKEFTARTVPLTEDFGSGDFYLILSWMIRFGICFKNGSRYTVERKDAVRKVWNEFVEKMKL